MTEARRPSEGPLTVGVLTLSRSVFTDAAELFPLYADPRCYQQGYRMAEPARDEATTRAMIESALTEQANRIMYTIRLAADGALGPAGTVVGSSSIGDIDLPNEKAHIGWTFYGFRWWGTVVNPTAKLALLSHLFDDCGFGRVRIQTDLVNTRSQAAIAKLGAVREGVARRDLRRHDGSWRDTVIYAIIRDDWPQVRESLTARVSESTAGR